MQNRGIKREQITDIILTHGHYDHSGAAMLFPFARIYLQEKEWEYVFRDDNPMSGELAGLREYLLRSREEGRVFLIRGDCRLENGLRLIEAPGHTPGSQMVEGVTQSGKTLFTGSV